MHVGRIRKAVDADIENLRLCLPGGGAPEALRTKTSNCPVLFYSPKNGYNKKNEISAKIR